MIHRRSIGRAVLAASLLLLTSAGVAGNAVLHPFLAAQPNNAPEEVNLAVEIPAGSVTTRPTTARCRARWRATTTRSTRWC